MKPLPLAAMITSMGLMVAARALGQQLPDYPRWNIEPGFGVVWHQQATFTTVSGPIVPSVLVKPYPDVRLGFIYRDSPRLALLISAGVAQVPFSTGYSMGAASDSAGRVIWNEGRYTLPGGEWFRFEAELGAKITALRRGRWHCNGVVGARPSHLRHVLAEAHSGEIIDSAIRPHTSLVGFLNDGWHLAGRAGAEVEYCFKNFNRLHIGIDYCYAPFTVWSGTYRLAHNTDQESRGTFEQRGSYAGFSFAYSFAWGAPKESWWMRRAADRNKNGATP